MSHKASRCMRCARCSRPNKDPIRKRRGMNPRKQSEFNCVSALAGAIVVLAATAAYGQTPPQTPPAAQAPATVTKQESPATGTKMYFGALTGIQMVARNAPVAGAEFGVRLRKNTQVVFE